MKHLKLALIALLISPSVTFAEAFIITGTSGNEIVLDRMWDRGCLPGTGGNDWTLHQRTLVGLELTTTLTDYQNGSSSPDCESGQVGYAEYTQVLTAEGIMVPFTWVDYNNQPSSAPAGLEGVSEANGASGLITLAQVVPQTNNRVVQLNGAAFCGVTDWVVGESPPSEVIIQCFTGGFNPGKGSIVVDDSSLPWKIYDGISVNPAEYPTLVPNYAPHSGPFEP